MLTTTSSSSTATAQWDGMSSGKQYEQYRSGMQLHDIDLVTKAAIADVTRQVPAAARLSIFATHIQPESTARSLYDRFVRLCSYYIEQTKRNRYMPLSEANLVCSSLLHEFVHAASQLSEAERALLLKLQVEYAPIAAAAQQANLLAATPEQIAAATATLTAAQSSVGSVGAAPTQEQGEAAASFQSRQQQYTQQQQAAQQAATAAQQALTDLTSKAAITGFPTVNGMDVSPSDAIISLFWTVMDVLFDLGGDSKLQNFFSLGKPGSQGADSLEVWAQRISKEYRSVSHLSDSSLSI